MRHYNVLVGFLPWILFGTLAGHTLFTLNLAILVALGLTLIFNHHELIKCFFLAWSTLLFFVFCLVAVVFLRNMWVMNHMSELVDTVLVIVSWGSLVMGRPFTEVYAKEHAPESIWHDPGFKQRHFNTTLVWSLIFLINLLVSVFYPNENYFFNLLRTSTAIILGYIVSLFIIDKKIGA